MILMRDETAALSAGDGGSISCSTPSIRIRTSNWLLVGSQWMSDARTSSHQMPHGLTHRLPVSCPSASRSTQVMWPPIESVQIGDGTWVVSVTDATGSIPAEVTLTAERPWMPKHNHGAPDYPVVTPGEPGTYTISKIDFFMAGYWQLKLNLVPASGDPDDATFSICVPQ